MASPDSHSSLDSSTAVQARDNTFPPLQGVLGVTVGGDVAQVIGSVPLSPTGDGSWVGSAALPPGTYGYQIIVSTNTGEVVLGEGGVESPPANQAQITIPEGAPGALFAFDQNTGAVNSGVAGIGLSTDVGQFEMIPVGGGNFEVSFSAPPGALINVQSVIAGQPTGQVAQVDSGPFGRIRVVVDVSGQIVGAESVATASLVIGKTDEGGNPLPGACFAAFSGNSVASQSCDSSDGAVDGFTTLQFLNGVPSGNVEIAETFTPPDQTSADAQQVGIQAGNNQLQLVTVGGAPEAPEGPGVTLTFFAQDLNGVALPGACFAVDDGEPVCDDDFDGVVTISGVQPGQRILSEPRPPEGFEAYPDTQIEVTGDEAFSVPHNVDAGAQPEAFTIGLRSVDQGGNPLPFACYVLDGGEQVCDDDGDGVVNFPNLEPGARTVAQSQTPEGFEPVADFQIQVGADETLDVPHVQILSSDRGATHGIQGWFRFNR